MSDLRLKEIEREWENGDRSPDIATRLREERLRSGLHVGYEVVTSTRLPQTTLSPREPLEVLRQESPGSTTESLGWGTAADPITIPSSFLWWVQPTPEGVGVAALPAVRDLAGISLRGTAVSRLEIEQLAGVFPHLRYLSLSDLAVVTADCLSLVPHFPRLVGLDLSGCSALNGAALDSVSGAASLHALDLSGVSMSQPSVASVGALANLHWLHLRQCRVEGAALLCLRGLDVRHFSAPLVTDMELQRLFEGWTLHELTLSPNGAVTGECLEALSRDHLERLVLFGCETVNDSLRPSLGSFSVLRRLDLGRIGRPRHIEELAGHPSLRELSLCMSSALTASDVSRLALPALERLDLSETDSLSRGDLEVLCRHSPRLEALAIDVAQGASLAPLSDLPLTELTMFGNTFSRNQIEEVADLDSLRKLQISARRIAPEGLAQLDRLSNIEILALRSNPLSVEVLAAAMAAMPRLRRLHLRGCRSLSGEDLDVLAPETREIYVREVSERTLKRLAEVVPQCRIFPLTVTSGGD